MLVMSHAFNQPRGKEGQIEVAYVLLHFDVTNRMCTVLPAAENVGSRCTAHPHLRQRPYLDNRPKQVCQVGFGGIRYRLSQQHMLCLGIISNIVELCETLQSLLCLFINLNDQQRTQRGGISNRCSWQSWTMETRVLLLLSRPPLLA